ncbi:MAG: hypothetical protein FRX49_04667 [Trebouxia sp. A1-2]|nr:MAG: hypothetical protein FRX49_04667 [Trebouxia sp. A1-2]
MQPALPMCHSHSGFTIGMLFDSEINTTVTASRPVRDLSGEIISNRLAMEQQVWVQLEPEQQAWAQQSFVVDADVGSD